MNVPTLFARAGSHKEMPRTGTSAGSNTNQYRKADLRAKVFESEKRELEDYSRANGLEMSDVIRDGMSMFKNGRLPVLGSIPCGPMQEAIAKTPYHEIVPPSMRPRADLGDFLLEASGDSMSPRIESGDLVLLRPDIEPSAGEVVAVQIFEDKGQGAARATLKRFFWEPGQENVTLKPINEEYQDIVVPAELVVVVGVFRGLVRRQGRF